jgi:hypothetical protein
VFAEQVLRWVLLLYPKGYRRQQESEIAGTYAEATAGATPAEALREGLSIAGHGLRVRLGLTSDRYAGAVLAAAMPYVLGSIAGLSGYMLYLLFKGPVNQYHETFRLYSRYPRHAGRHTGQIILAYSPVPVLVVAAALVLSALIGRWSWARWVAAATAVTAAGTILVVFELRRGDHIYVLTTFPGFEMPLMLLAFALMVLAVPTDIRTFTTRRVHTVMVALTVIGLLHLAWVREGFAWSLITVLPAVVVIILVLALAAGLRDALLPGAVALTCAPWLIQPLTGDLFGHGFTGTQYVLLVALAIVLVLAAGSIRHRRLSHSPNL